jgi:hypothetical protein
MGIQPQHLAKTIGLLAGRSYGLAEQIPAVLRIGIVADVLNQECPGGLRFSGAQLSQSLADKVRQFMFGRFFHRQDRVDLTIDECLIALRLSPG